MKFVSSAFRLCLSSRLDLGIVKALATKRVSSAFRLCLSSRRHSRKRHFPNWSRSLQCLSAVSQFETRQGREARGPNLPVSSAFRLCLSSRHWPQTALAMSIWKRLQCLSAVSQFETAHCLLLFYEKDGSVSSAFRLCLSSRRGLTAPGAFLFGSCLQCLSAVSQFETLH